MKRTRQSTILIVSLLILVITIVLTYLFAPVNGMNRSFQSDAIALAHKVDQHTINYEDPYVSDMHLVYLDYDHRDRNDKEQLVYHYLKLLGEEGHAFYEDPRHDMTTYMEYRTLIEQLLEIDLGEFDPGAQYE